MVGFKYQSSAWKENRWLSLGFKLGEEVCAEVTRGTLAVSGQGEAMRWGRTSSSALTVRLT